jgi:CRP-like cAMP-binding protein
MRGVLTLGCGSVKLSFRFPGGNERVLSVLAPGGIFGAAHVLLERPCRIEITALTDAVLVFIPRASVLALLARNRSFAFNVVNALAENAVSLLAEFEITTLRKPAQRLAQYLNSLAEPAGDSGLWVARLPGTKTLIASRLGFTKETLSRSLRSLAERGVITVDHREIRILNRTRLEQIACDSNGQ